MRGRVGGLSGRRVPGPAPPAEGADPSLRRVPGGNGVASAAPGAGVPGPSQEDRPRSAVLEALPARRAEARGLRGTEPGATAASAARCGGRDGRWRGRSLGAAGRWFVRCGGVGECAWAVLGVRAVLLSHQGVVRGPELIRCGSITLSRRK